MVGMKSYLIKKGLINYNKNRKVLEELKFKKEECESRLYSLPPGSIVKKPEGNPPKRSMMIIERMNDLDEVNKQIELCNYEITIVDEFIESLSKHRQLVVDKYINEVPEKQLEHKFFMSRQSIYRLVERLIEGFDKFE